MPTAIYFLNYHSYVSHFDTITELITNRLVLSGKARGRIPILPNRDLINHRTRIYAYFIIIKDLSSILIDFLYNKIRYLNGPIYT